MELLMDIYNGSAEARDADIDRIDKITSQFTRFESKRIQFEDDVAATKRELREKIEEAEREVEAGTKALSLQRKRIERLEADRREMTELQEQKEMECEEGRRRIEEYKEESSKEVEQIDEVEARRMKEVPRLKKKIALCANITGITWKYEDENKRAGVVAIPERKEVRRFSFDPLLYDDYDMANKLWDCMDGKI
eukprot:CAMPEP_0172501926 /NCGR_PEP_ID=MMETSP1066-20121228/155098_1 /TAXON_ID=671091 /ORGANISM="Coscinodiscus wailesii, Strain CCMP2513" /LENGTH=193 /DNA_ID=CAMNT_0013276989 /DNA_START=394 /DNA_END=975 /DNA_ORIENTATION=-